MTVDEMARALADIDEDGWNEVAIGRVKKQRDEARRERQKARKERDEARVERDDAIGRLVAARRLIEKAIIKSSELDELLREG